MAKGKSKKSKKKKQQEQLCDRIADALVVGDGFDLTAVDPAATPELDGKEKDAVKLQQKSAPEVADLQERLYANKGTGPAVLLIVQGMDTSGKGGIMRHVVGQVDPQGVHLTSFKAPTKEELSHPFLWRIRNALPSSGMIGVFDRSQYEDVLIVRVRNLVPPTTWKRRYSQINAFEQSATDRGIHIIKVMLHISPDEQARRLTQRVSRPDKYWKYNPGDVDERELWPAYQEAYQVALEKCSTQIAPWYVVPADNKWYARFAVHNLLLRELRSLQLDWPPADFDPKVEKKRIADSLPDD